MNEEGEQLIREYAEMLGDSREAQLHKALKSLVIALDHNNKNFELPVIDEVWYAWEVAERVLEGDSYDTAMVKFVDGSPPPERWQKEMEKNESND